MIYSCMKYSWIFYIRCFGCDTVEELCDSPHSKALDVTLVGKKTPTKQNNIINGQFFLPVHITFFCVRISLKKTVNDPRVSYI